MCGIAGVVNFRHRTPDLEGVLNAMGHALWRRGPDHHGIQTDHDGQVGFVHRRLSVVDLSEAGHQPMVSADGRYLMLFNGEIYNHRQIREDLNRDHPGLVWQGHSDTEVFLQAIRLHSIDWALARSVGMWAFAIWDRWEKQLTLGRDRAGEKPLYYYENDGTTAFASDLSALRKLPGFDDKVSNHSLSIFLQCGFVPAPGSIFEKVRKVPSGACLTVDASGSNSKIYWSALEKFRLAREAPFQGDEAEARSVLGSLLDQSIADQMVADVPVGAFLSGGVDSTIVTAWMQKHASNPVRTYTVGFDEAAYDEAKFARAVADELGTSHTELYVRPSDAMDLIPELPDIYAEPFADVSQIPVVLLSRLARTEVTVALSGDGGDELFGGYNRHVFSAGRAARLLNLPGFSRNAAAGVLRMFSGSYVADLVQASGAVPRQLSLKAQKLADILSLTDRTYLHAHLLRSAPQAGSLVTGGMADLNDVLPVCAREFAETPEAERMMLNDFLVYMQDDVLTKVDRGAMSASLEVRAPFLDHRLVEFAFSLPLTQKINAGTGKRILRNLAYQQVPRRLIDRPKSGFTVPIGEWLKGPLKDWAAALLDPTGSIREDGLDPGRVAQVWSEHLAGQRDHAQVLWNLLSYRSWQEHSLG